MTTCLPWFRFPAEMGTDACSGSESQRAEAGYIFPYAIDPDNDVTLFYPKPGKDNPIETGEFTVPGSESDFPFRLTGLAGICRVRAIICENEVDIARFAEISARAKLVNNDLIRLFDTEGRAQIDERADSSPEKQGDRDCRIRKRRRRLECFDRPFCPRSDDVWDCLFLTGEEKRIKSWKNRS